MIIYIQQLNRLRRMEKSTREKRDFKSEIYAIYASACGWHPIHVLYIGPLIMLKLKCKNFKNILNVLFGRE